MLFCAQNYNAPTKAMKLSLKTTTWARHYYSHSAEKETETEKNLCHLFKSAIQQNTEPKFEPKTNSKAFSTSDFMKCHGYAQCATHTLPFFTYSILLVQHSSTFTNPEPMRNLGRREFIHSMEISPSR